MRLFTTLVAAAVLGCTALSAQIPLTLHSSFVDNRAGGNGNIGVTRSPKDGRFYVLDFSNANTVHQFDAAGSFLAETPTANCSPGARSPNGITYDPTDDTLWIVDNSGDVVVHYSVEGKCLGGWSFTKPSTNPVGITHDTRANTLWIASSGMLTEWDKQGNRLQGTINILGSSIISGVAYDLATDRFFVTTSSGNTLYEFDRAGTQVSATPLSGFGIRNTQGLHLDFARRQLLVVDNTLSTTFIFDMAACQGTVARKGGACEDSQQTDLRMDWAGCADLGKTLTLTTYTNLANTSGVFFAIGLSDTQGFGQNLPIDLTALGAKGCSLQTSMEAVVGPVNNPGGGASLSLPLPNNPTLKGLMLHFQGIQAGPPLNKPLPVALSDHLSATFQ